MDKTVLASEAHEYIGRKIEFLFYPGWEDPWRMTGYLHGVTPNSEVGIYMHISDDKTLDAGTNPNSIGGYAIWPNETVTILN